MPTIETKAAYETFLRENYCTVAARVLFLWDFCVTLDGEIRWVWGQKTTPATVLFVMNRYVNLLITILELWDQTPFQTTQLRTLHTRAPDPSPRGLIHRLSLYDFTCICFMGPRLEAGSASAPSVPSLAHL
ncbi:hypothetical protein PsYK624_028250 [Phanerochaete sordida]|uniref:DUF6533 domain-containing protein n=1 Tax=Phanerochaete sordida TaxID=48140 RepID=A0A9P3G2M0_9APHY|nr:hypothetical protein PsYK624_028250 [Phanerochaete sordida]